MSRTVELATRELRREVVALGELGRRHAVARAWSAGTGQTGSVRGLVLRTRVETEDSGNDIRELFGHLNLALTSAIRAARMMVHVQVRMERAQQIAKSAA